MILCSVVPVVGISPGFMTLLVTVDFFAISLRASSSEVITLHCSHQNKDVNYQSDKYDGNQWVRVVIIVYLPVCCPYMLYQDRSCFRPPCLSDS